MRISPHPTPSTNHRPQLSWRISSAIGCFPPTAGGTARRVHRPRTSSTRTNPTVGRSTTDARSLSRAHPYMAGRSVPPTRARATYLAGVVRHTSTSSVGWIAANVVHVAAAEREDSGRAEGCVRGCLRLRWGGLEVVCAVTHRLLRAVGCSIRQQCSHRRCSTVRGGRTDAGGEKA